jgi:voltage-gated potassium channel
MTHHQSLKHRIFKVIDDHSNKQPLNRLFHGLLFSLIILSSLFLIFETVKPIASRFSILFIVFEWITVVFFTLEYVLRVYTCTELHAYQHGVLGRLKFVLTPLMLIDLLSIIPLYLLLFKSDYSGFYLFNIFRIIRLFKAIRYINAFKMVGAVFYHKKDQLLVSLVFISFAFVFLSSMIYIAEKDAQPIKFPDIPSSMWFTISTITSVGFGDVYPITTFGKFVAGIISISGLILFAIPMSILTSGFLKISNPEERKSCPHCGKKI